MPRETPFLRAVGAVLFTAACAYALARFVNGAALETGSFEAERYAVTESAALEGVAVRRELPVPDGADTFALVSGERLCAASASAISGEESSSSLFFPDTDGYEYLSPEMLDGLTAEELDALIAAPLHGDGAAASGRLVEGFDWYYAARGETELAAGVYELCFEGFGESLRAELVRSGGGVLVFRLTGGGEKYMSLRRTEAELIFDRAEGIYLPPDAVWTDEDGKSFVYRLTAAGKEAAEAEIIYKTEDFLLAALGGELHEGERLLRNAGQEG